MASKVRFGIIGTGGIARAHAVGLAAMANDAEIVSCCDVQASRAEDFAKTYGARRNYTSTKEMLDAGGIDVVCVCTPHPHHADPMVMAAERGIHGVVEKPLTNTLADADRLLEAAAKAGTFVSSMSQRRWFPAAQRIRKAIDDGKMGDKIVMGESYCEMWRDEAYYRRDAWRGRWDTEGGGVMTNQSPHNIDFLLWYMGPAIELKAYWANVNHPYVEIEDNAVCILKFKSGGLGIIKGTVSMNPPRRIHGVTIVGESGPTVSLDCWEVPPEERKLKTGPSDIGTNDIWSIKGEEDVAAASRQHALDYGSGDLPNFHAHQLRDIIGAVREKRAPAVTGLEGRRVVAVIQGIYESGRTGKAVTLSD
ncbi:MAG: Gfo/Idh/MocA family oxidoreductase [Chloroflexota bacterium]|nr:MAG: Gfo/Idh/MocA family oxidoreductase [Chloroflexota bacterium]